MPAGRCVGEALGLAETASPSCYAGNDDDRSAPPRVMTRAPHRPRHDDGPAPPRAGRRAHRPALLVPHVPRAADRGARPASPHRLHGLAERRPLRLARALRAHRGGAGRPPGPPAPRHLRLHQGRDGVHRRGGAARAQRPRGLRLPPRRGHPLRHRPRPRHLLAGRHLHPQHLRQAVRRPPEGRDHAGRRVDRLPGGRRRRAHPTARGGRSEDARPTSCSSTSDGGAA